MTYLVDTALYISEEENMKIKTEKQLAKLFGSLIQEAVTNEGFFDDEKQQAQASNGDKEDFARETMSSLNQAVDNLKKLADATKNNELYKLGGRLDVTRQQIEKLLNVSESAEISEDASENMNNDKDTLLRRRGSLLQQQAKIQKSSVSPQEKQKQLQQVQAQLRGVTAQLRHA